ncbi:DUF732 domain-containing protein [Rhodococcus hoagii]|nr:DUF732 domain-containing protein [Prescottella equi]MBM4654108.1 DUF732 domain-containing protein [Prescottella equi]MBM4719582.1 DUF732 domain-containing protein [Prescottella equi]NKR23381.1 DUF732 domain-containing protein [Prescottella equi]NKT56008.1 DUF732 domain-containing protein [Prescottella equi]
MRTTRYAAAVALAAAALTLTSCSSNDAADAQTTFDVVADAISSDADGVYWNALAELGFPDVDRAQLVDLGQEACNYLREGGNIVGAAFHVNDIASGKFDASQSGSIVGAALTTYCLDYAKTMGQGE